MKSRVADDFGAGGDSNEPAIRLHLYLLPLLLVVIALVLAGCYLASEEVDVTEQTAPPTLAAHFAWFFDLNSENSLPAWYSASLWLFAAFLATSVGAKSRSLNDRILWRCLAAVFAFLSLDEAIAIHERIGSVMAHWIKLSGYFHYVWVLYGILLVFLLTAVFGRFVWSLPRPVSLSFLAAGVVFLSGALGFEMIGAAVESGQRDFPVGLNWRTLIALEELAEMLGVTTLIFGLLMALKLTPASSVRWHVVDSS